MSKFHTGFKQVSVRIQPNKSCILQCWQCLSIDDLINTLKSFALIQRWIKNQNIDVFFSKNKVSLEKTLKSLKAGKLELEINYNTQGLQKEKNYPKSQIAGKTQNSYLNTSLKQMKSVNAENKIQKPKIIKVDTKNSKIQESLQ